MSTVETPLRKKIREAAANLGIKSQKATLSSQITSLRNKVLADWGALTAPAGSGQFGLETLSQGLTPMRNQAFNIASDGDVGLLVKGLSELKMSPRHIEQTAEQVVTLFDKGYDANTIMRGGEASDKYKPLSMVIGRTAASHLARTGTEGFGLEAFGDDINRLATDDRLTMDLMIMRPWDSILDKALARVTESSPVVTIRVPAPEAWNWAATQSATSTAYQRNGASNTFLLRDLYRNPAPVNSAPAPIVAFTANDSGSVLWNSTTTYYKTGKNVSLLDISKSSTTFGYQMADRTDLVADGGTLNGVIVQVTATVSSVAQTEYFLLNTRPYDLAMYVISPSNKSSGQRQVMMGCSLIITAGTTQWNGNASTIAAALTDAKVEIDVRVNSILNIQTGILEASGSVQTELLQLSNGTTISGTTNTMYGTLVASFAAYSVDLYFDEENQRKANLAVWVQYREEQFVVPRSRVYFTEYSLSQDMDQNAVEATSSIVALGNGRRGLDIIVNALSDIASGLAYAAANPELQTFDGIDQQSFASSLVSPTVVTTTLDYSTEELNTMNESTRLSEIHGRFRARFLSMVTIMFAKSLMLNQYKPGETPVIKAWVHSSIADIVIGILDYHPDLKDEATIATGADYSMTLPNGYRLDVIKTNWDCMQQRLYAVPVIESDPASVLSGASIRDCGTVTVNYTPTNSGAVVRRVATTTREIVFMSNKTGIMMQIQGLESQLGTYGFTPIALNANYSASLAV